ncbi:MAG: FKBP-type peptidyl-prolyl cis-trans isomerase [Acidimicrobiia bacterium]
MGTQKRERQRAAREAKTSAEIEAERRRRVKRTIVRVVGGAAVILLALFLWSTFLADDGGSDVETGEAADATDAQDESGDDTESPAQDSDFSNPALAEDVLARGAPDPAPPPADLPADALEIKTLTEGEGAGAEAGDTVTVHYLGLLADGTVFDQSWEQGQPLDVTLGQGMVIQGWDEGLVGAKIGERRRLDIGSDKAYGTEGAPGAIPPDAPLGFVIDIVDVQPAEAGGG